MRLVARLVSQVPALLGGKAPFQFLEAPKSIVRPFEQPVGLRVNTSVNRMTGLFKLRSDRRQRLYDVALFAVGLLDLGVAGLIKTDHAFFVSILAWQSLRRHLLSRSCGRLWLQSRLLAILDGWPSNPSMTIWETIVPCVHSC